jgi:hypothetical protein
VTPEEREHTVTHEAGHVAAAWLQLGDGAIRGAITIVERAWILGSANVGIDPPSDEAIRESWYAALAGQPIGATVRDWAETTVVLLLAGDVALVRAADVRHQFELQTEPTPETPEQQGMVAAAIAAGEAKPDADMTAVKQLLSAISASPKEADAYRAWLLERTWQLTRNPWFEALVDALARELLAHETLEKEAVLAIIHRVTDLPIPAPRHRFEGTDYIPDE